MLTRFIKFMITFILLFNTFCYAYETNKQITKIWNSFLKIVTTNNCNDFIKISNSRIKCLDCLDNTDQEHEQLIQFKLTDSNWYNKIYKEKIYIATNEFCKKDLKLIFTPSILKRLKSGKTIFRNLNQKEYEILVTVINPNELQLGSEGMQHYFRFKKIDDKFYFSEIGTIP